MKCPKCGSEGTLEFREMYQYSKRFKVKKDGTIGSKFAYEDCGPEDWHCVDCTCCGAHWLSDDVFFENDKLILEDDE